MRARYGVTSLLIASRDGDLGRALLGEEEAAVASPMPEVPPVIRATLFNRRMGFELSGSQPFSHSRFALQRCEPQSTIRGRRG